MDVVEIPYDTAPDDPLLAAIRGGADLRGRLRAAQESVAVECARLRFLEKHPDAVDDLVGAGRAIGRRIRAIKKLVELDLAEARHAPDLDDVDLLSPLVRRVIALLVDEVVHIARDVLPKDEAEPLVTEFEERLRDEPGVPWP